MFAAVVDVVVIVVVDVVGQLVKQQWQLFGFGFGLGHTGLDWGISAGASRGYNAARAEAGRQ